MLHLFPLNKKYPTIENFFVKTISRYLTELIEQYAEDQMHANSRPLNCESNCTFFSA